MTGDPSGRSIQRRLRPAGVRDVARLAGVSVATVSRALTGGGYPVADETRQKVRDAATALGFVPNALAKGLSRARTETIGLVVPTLNAHYARVVSGIEQVAAEHNLAIVFCRTDHRDHKRDAAIQLLVEQQVEGIALCVGVADGPVTIPGLAGRLPLVAVGELRDDRFPTVVIDNAQAGRTLTEHLLDLGHWRLAFLTGPVNWWDGESRLLGFTQALASRNLAPLGVLRGDYSAESGYRLARQHLSHPGAATALVCATDRIALGAMAAAHDLGLRIPEDLSLAGFDNFESNAYLRPTLTSMAMPGHELGIEGMRHLAALINGTPLSDGPPLHARIITRESSGPAPL